MASIVKRRNRYSVVYNITDENGVKRQNGKPSLPMLTQKSGRLKLNTNSKMVLLSFLHRKPYTICLKIIWLFMA